MAVGDRETARSLGTKTSAGGNGNAVNAKLAGRSAGGGKPPSRSASRVVSKVAAAAHGARTANPEAVLQTVEDVAVKAARLVISADFLLIAAGAGFSADSGLKVYKDIGDIPAYHRMDLEYGDLCVPSWLRRDPALFFGFWGACFNDYMTTPPHAGYGVVRRWVDFEAPAGASSSIGRSSSMDPPARRGSGSVPALARTGGALAHGDSARALQLPQDRPPTERGGARGRDARPATSRPAAAASVAGGVKVGQRDTFVFTSNVDTHFATAGIAGERVYEIHGNVATWQCGMPCCNKTFTLPSDHRFHIDRETMHAPRFAPIPPKPPPEHAPNAHASSVACPHGGGVGEESGGGGGGAHREALRAGGGRGEEEGGCESAVRDALAAMSLGGEKATLSRDAKRLDAQLAGGGGGWALSPYGGSAGAAGVVKREEVGAVNWVACRQCGRVARPNVLMFEDTKWVENEKEEKLYKRWVRRAMVAMKTGAKVVVLEGGAGKRVPTVRDNSNRLAKQGAALIRINLDFPNVPAGGRDRLSVRGGVRDTLLAIDAAATRLMQSTPLQRAS